MEGKFTLKELRVQSGLTVKKIADTLKIAPSSYYNYEHGTREMRISQVLILAELFEVSEREVIEAQLNSRSSCRQYNLRKH